MPDQVNSGTPSGTPAAPALNPSAAPPPPEFSGPSSYVARRVGPMAEKMQQQLQGEQPAADAQPPSQQPPPQQQSGERMVRIGEHERSEQAWNELAARDAEQQVRRQALPQAPGDYQAILPPDWQAPADLPPGTKFEFDMNSPALAQARAIAHASGMPQEKFSELLGVFASTKIGEQQNNARLRDANLRQLGSNGPMRVDAVATWLTARAGQDGAQVGNFLKAFPSAPIVKAMESLIKQFSSQGGADYSGQHRESADAEAGKIPGYENMSFAQVRARQMVERMRDPNYSRGVRPGGPRRGE
jgi:hypothetical protein